MNKLAYILLVAVLFSCSTYAQNPQQKGLYEVRLTFKNVVGNNDMQLGGTYQNAFNETFTIKMFKYYISNICFKNNDGKVSATGSYHLVNQADPTSTSFILMVNNRFDNISFLLGVDSIRNVSGTQTGDLDPSKGMFWTWNTGYIMAKLEAASPASAAPNNNASYHIGGFKKGENTTRAISLDLPKQSDLTNKHTYSEIIIQADAGKWFNAVHELRIAHHPSCTNPGELAGKFADNYARMFTIMAVKD